METLDFFHDEALVADPYPVLDRMREAAPVLREHAIHVTKENHVH